MVEEIRHGFGLVHDILLFVLLVILICAFGVYVWEKLSNIRFKATKHKVIEQISFDILEPSWWLNETPEMERARMLLWYMFTRTWMGLQANGEMVRDILSGKVDVVMVDPADELKVKLTHWFETRRRN